ncbi:MAG: hypothetical protein ACE5I3_15845 [Phycisphaerae bacterium]
MTDRQAADDAAPSSETERLVGHDWVDVDFCGDGTVILFGGPGVARDELGIADIERRLARIERAFGFTQ